MQHKEYSWRVDISSSFGYVDKHIFEYLVNYHKSDAYKRYEKQIDDVNKKRLYTPEMKYFYEKNFSMKNQWFENLDYNFDDKLIKTYVHIDMPVLYESYHVRNAVRGFDRLSDVEKYITLKELTSLSGIMHKDSSKAMKNVSAIVEQLVVNQKIVIKQTK